MAVKLTIKKVGGMVIVKSGDPSTAKSVPYEPADVSLLYYPVGVIQGDVAPSLKVNFRNFPIYLRENKFALSEVLLNDGTTDYVITNYATYEAAIAAVFPDDNSGSVSSAWGSITGTLSDQTDLNAALALKAPLASPTFTGTVAGITKTMVGLGNVDNTSDANKPVSTAQATAIALKQDAIFQPNAVVSYFGDSHWAYGYDSGNPYFDSWGTSTWFNILTGGKYYQPVGANLGVAGNTTTQMVARLGAALAYKPDLVLIDGGGNDATAGATAAAIQANLLTIVSAYQSIGAKIIIMTIFPRYSPNAFTSPQETIRQAVNAYILTLAGSGVYVVNPESSMNSGLFQSDGIHLTSVGANLVGGLFATVGNTLINQTNISSFLTADNSLTTNVVLAGTSGGLNTATGSVATSWTGLGNSAGGGTVVFSKGTTGGYNQQIITLSGTYTGTNRYAGLLSNFATASLIAGDVTESFLDYEVTSALTNVSGLSISTTYNGAGGYISDSYSYYPIDGLAQSIPVGRYQLRGVPFTVPVGLTSIDCNVIIFFANGTSLPVAGVVKIWKAGIRKALGTAATTAYVTTAGLIQRKTRRAIANVASTLLVTDYLIAYTSLTATRALTLGAASGFPDMHFVLKDEAGTAGTNALTIVGTVNGSSNPTAVNANYGQYRFYSNGVAWFTE